MWSSLRFRLELTLAKMTSNALKMILGVDRKMNVKDFKMFSEISETPEVFSNLINSKAQFQLAAEKIKTRNISNVIILARGTSDNAGHYLKFLIEVKLGLPVGLASPSSVSIYGAKVDFENTLVIALSQSGRSPDLITFASAAREGGALLIAMTNNSDSPLAKVGDIHIDLSAGPEVAVAATKSYSAELLASLLLVDNWMGNKEEVRSHLVDSSRDCIANLSEVDSFANSLDAAREIVVIGRGYSYANAKELALKIQETSYIPVQGMSSADYQHGPIATLNKNSQVIVLAPSGMPKKALEDSIARIRQSEPELIWLGSDQLALKEEKVIRGSSQVKEEESTIIDAALIQYLTLGFAVKNGFNPDSPAGLSKVTKTL
jgi:glucosamine--fructose-6-phosphate aminotransferase (isomerizing)